MIVTCGSCNKKYKLTDEHFQGKDKISIRCPSCKGVIEAVREASKSTGGPTTVQKISKLESTNPEGDVPDPENLAMPDGKRVSLAILAGKDAGTVIPLEKTVVVIGRVDSDVVLNDPEISRRHAQVELKGIQIVLRDLKSTNGTYVNEQRITSTVLENQSEFRIGSSILMLILTENEP